MEERLAHPQTAEGRCDRRISIIGSKLSPSSVAQFRLLHKTLAFRATKHYLCSRHKGLDGHVEAIQPFFCASKKGFDLRFPHFHSPPLEKNPSLSEKRDGAAP